MLARDGLPESSTDLVTLKISVSPAIGLAGSLREGRGERGERGERREGREERGEVKVKATHALAGLEVNL